MLSRNIWCWLELHFITKVLSAQDFDLFVMLPHPVRFSIPVADLIDSYDYFWSVFREI